MTVVLIQGMRRSGTTVVFDLFASDPAFSPLYEPLAQARVTRGGGSGIQKRDLFESVRHLRQRFLEAHPGSIAEEALNHGAPRRPELELEAALPEPLRRYLTFLVESAPDVVLKFTRMAAKIAELHAVAPHGWLIHAVRDPRSVATSYLLRPYYELRHRRLRRLLYFSWRSRQLPWSLAPLSKRLVETRFDRHLLPPADVVRVLVLWQHTFRATHDAGTKLFGDRYILLRHEDLAGNPHSAAAALYRRLERPVPPSLEGLLAKIHRPSPAYRAGAGAWRRLARRLELGPELRAAGYDREWDL